MSQTQMIKEESQAQYQGLIEHGTRLANLTEGEGGFKEYFSGNLALDPKRHGNVREKMAFTAVMMENTKRWLASLDETTRAMQVGGYIDYLFPLIRAAFTNNPILDLVSVQPMQKKVGLIFFLNYIIGQTKGTAVKGQRVFDAFEGYAGGSNYSSSKIDSEQIGTTNSVGNAAASGQLTYLPLRPGTLVITIGETTPLVLRDDSNGGLVKVSGSETLGTCTVNYQTGAVALAVTGSGVTLETSKTITAQYEYDSEISGNIPQIDIQLTSSAIQAVDRALRVRYSQDAAFDLKAEFGIDADATLVNGVAELIRAEQAREVVHDLWMAAGQPVATFPASSSSTYVTRLEAFRDLAYFVEYTSQQIYSDTQRLHGNWLICDTPAATIMRSLPSGMFEAAPVDDTTSGVQFIGTFMGRFRVWQDKLLASEPGAVGTGNILMGYKGNDWIDATYVWAPYQPLYVTNAITLDDFMTRKAMRMRYAKKLINPRVYKRITIT